MKVRVDSGRCQGHWLCAMLAPDSFALGDGGHASATDELATAEREDEVLEASEACPEQAIVIARDET